MKKIKNENFLYSFSPICILIITNLIYHTNGSKPTATVNDLMIKYFSIWTFDQWIYSLISLVIIYFVAGKIFNKYCSKKIDWKNLSTATILLLIGFDLVLNFAIGIYYMSYRETALGQLMLSCPIAVSPFIFAIELVLIFIIYILKRRAK